MNAVTRACGSISIAAFALAMTACSGQNPDTATQPAPSTPATSASEASGKGSDGTTTTTTAASDSGSSSTSVAVPEENKDLKAPVFKDYPGITSNSDQGAEQTLKFFFDAMYYAYATGDTAPLEKVFPDHGCETCADIKADISSKVAAGTFLIPAPVTIEDLAVVDTLPNGKTEVFIEFERPAFQEHHKDGTRESYPAKTIRGAAHVQKNASGSWSVMGVEWENA